MSSASSRTVMVSADPPGLFAKYSRMNTTGSTVKPEISRIESRIIRTRRDVQDSVVVSRAAGGNLPSELHFPLDAGSVDGITSPPPATKSLDLNGAMYTLMRSALQTDGGDIDQTYDAPVTLTGSDLTVPGGSGLNYEPGDIVQFLEAGAVLGYYRVIAVNADVLTFDLRNDAASVTAVDQARRGARLTNGSTQLPHIVTVEDKLDVGLAQFEVFPEMHVNTMALRIADGEISTIDFGFVGTDSNGLSDTPVPAPDDTADKRAPVTQVYNSKGHVPVLHLQTLSAQGDIDLKEWSIDVANGMEPRTVIGKLPAISIRSGTLRVQGAMKAYFDDTNKDLYTAAINDEEAEAIYVAENDEGLAIAISLPRLKFTSEARDNTGQDTDVFLDLNYTTLADPLEDDSIRIQFFDLRV